MEIKEVNFAGNYHHVLKSDNGTTTYNAPQWLDGNGDGLATPNTTAADKNYPIAYTQNSKPVVGAKFKVAGLPSGQSVKIRANSAQGLEIPETSVSPLADGTITLQPTTAASNLVHEIQCHNANDDTAFKIDWDINIANMGWTRIGSTQHTVYITMADPIKTAAGLMSETLFSIGCRNAKGLGIFGAGPQAVVDAIYNDFKDDRNVQKVIPGSGTLDGVGMKFWNSSATNADSTTELLAARDGRCGAWARLFIDVLRTQGIDAQMMGYYAPLVPQQNFIADLQTYFPGSNRQYKEVFFVKSWTLEANPFAPTDNAGIEAQTKPNPQAYFADHALVAYGGKLYDPSYGSNTFASHQAWEDATLDAFGAYMDVPLPSGSNVWIWKADQKGSTETIAAPVNY